MGSLPIYFITLLIVLLAGFAGKVNHAIYISVVEIDHKLKTQKASVKIKVFTNDLQDALFNQSRQPLSFTETSTCENGRDSTVISKYFNEHFKCTINGNSSILVLKNCELVGDSVWLYFNFNCPASWEDILVRADFLMELFPTQSNVISIRHGDNSRYLRLSKKETAQKATFR